MQADSSACRQAEKMGLWCPNGDIQHVNMNSRDGHTSVSGRKQDEIHPSLLTDVRNRPRAKNAL